MPSADHGPFTEHCPMCSMHISYADSSLLGRVWSIQLENAGHSIVASADTSFRLNLVIYVVFFFFSLFFFTQNCRGMSEKNSRPPQLCLSQGQSGRKFLEEQRAKKVGCCLVCRGEGRRRPCVVLSTRCAFYFIADGDGHDWSL